MFRLLKRAAWLQAIRSICVEGRAGGLHRSMTNALRSAQSRPPERHPECRNGRSIRSPDTRALQLRLRLRDYGIGKLQPGMVDIFSRN